jgi:hypothetical protein
MRQKNGLRSLQMSVAGHYTPSVSFCKLNKRSLEEPGRLEKRIYFRAQEEAKISRYLIVTAPASVQLVTHIADGLGELILNEAVYVFSVTILEIAVVFMRLPAYLVESPRDSACFFFA